MAQSTPPAVFVLPWIPPPTEALARATRAGGGRTRHVAGDTMSRRHQRCYHQQRWQKHARAQPGRHGTCATQSALSGSGQPGRMATCTWCASVASRTLGHRRAALHTGARPRHMYMPAPLQPDLPPCASHREDRKIHPAPNSVDARASQPIQPYPSRGRHPDPSAWALAPGQHISHILPSDRAAMYARRARLSPTVTPAGLLKPTRRASTTGRTRVLSPCVYKLPHGSHARSGWASTNLTV